MCCLKNESQYPPFQSQEQLIRIWNRQPKTRTDENFCPEQEVLFISIFKQNFDLTFQYDKFYKKMKTKVWKMNVKIHENSMVFLRKFKLKYLGWIEWRIGWTLVEWRATGWKNHGSNPHAQNFKKIAPSIIIVNAKESPI